MLIGSLLVYRGIAQKIPYAPITKAYAFVEIQTAGNVPVDDNGNQMQAAQTKVYTLYIETNGNALPVWKTASTSDMVFTLAKPEKVINQPVTVGTEKETGKILKISATKGKTLWSIEMGEGKPKKSTNRSVNKMLLEGIYKGKKITYPIKEIHELESLPHY